MHVSDSDHWHVRMQCQLQAQSAHFNGSSPLPDPMESTCIIARIMRVHARGEVALIGA